LSVWSKSVIVSKVVSIQWLSIWSKSVVVSEVVSIQWLSVRSESIVGLSIVVTKIVSKVVSIQWLSVRSESIVELSISVQWLSVWSNSIVELAVGVSAIVVSIEVAVHGKKASNLIVVGNSTQWVLAKTPSSHVSIGVSGSSTPRELHASVGRKDSISGTSGVSVSVAKEWEFALVDELG
jgi:hypothetical protein